MVFTGFYICGIELNQIPINSKEGFVRYVSSVINSILFPTNS